MELTTSQGFGVTARSTVDTRKLDPTAIIVFHQAYVHLTALQTLETQPVLVMSENTFVTRYVVTVRARWAYSEFVLLGNSVLKRLVIFLGYDVTHTPSTAGYEVLSRSSRAPRWVGAYSCSKLHYDII